MGFWNQVGTDIKSNTSFVNLGYSLSLSSNGSILAVGLEGDDSQGNNAGAVKVYENNNSFIDFTASIGYTTDTT